MSRVIWKFHLASMVNVFALPRGAKVLTAQIQAGLKQLWVEVDPGEETEDRTFLVIGTGLEFDAAGLIYVATVQQGPFVWHVYEKGPCT